MLIVGQRVKTKLNNGNALQEECALNDKIGTIIDVDLKWHFPYEVKFDDAEIQEQNEYIGIRLFKENELEVIE